MVSFENVVIGVGDNVRTNETSRHTETQRGTGPYSVRWLEWSSVEQQAEEISVARSRRGRMS
jgi:hypothetical protein